MTHESYPTDIPLPPRKRGRVDWGHRVARGLCVLFAAVGLLPFLLLFVVRSTWTRDWAVQETVRLLREQGIEATYGIQVRLWPLALQLDDLVVESNDGNGPALRARRVRVRPRFFALFAGKLAIDQVEVHSPRVRLVLRDGKLRNLDLNLPSDEPSKKPTKAPFDVIAVTDAEIDLDLDGTRISARDLDVDVTADDEIVLGTVFEVALRAGTAAIHRPRTPMGAPPGAAPAIDDDALCAVEGRVRIEPRAILVRRLHAIAMADLDPAEGSTPSCALPPDDKRRVELGLGHLLISVGGAVDPSVPAIAEGSELDLSKLSIDGHVRARAPVALAARFVTFPDTDGWIGVDVDVHFAPGATLPDVSGQLEGRDLRIGRYHVAERIHSEVVVRPDKIESPKTTLRLGNGDVTLSDTVFEKSGFKLRTRLDVSELDFQALMRDLGVHPRAHVGWTVHELHAPQITGTVYPLRLDGEFTARTADFGVYDRPADDPKRERIVGFREAFLSSHLAVRPDSIKFQNTRAQLPNSVLEGGYVSLGFDEDLRVDVPVAQVHLQDISPIGPVAMKGDVRASVRVGGMFGRPEPEGDVQQIVGFTVADMAFGNVTAAHVKVDVDKPLVELTGVKAQKGKSEYEAPNARLSFGLGKGFVVDALATTQAFDYRDLLSMFALDDDPRFADYAATVGARAQVHVALGGPEDKCGGGFISVRSHLRLKDVVAFGERFASGEADVDYVWHDREQGIAGADVDVRSFVLNKASIGATQLGTVLGAATIRRGGQLDAHVVADGIPLSRIDALGEHRRLVEGSVAAVVQVTGNLDDFQENPGFVANAEIEVSPVRVRGVPFGDSHLRLVLTQRATRVTTVTRRTGCGKPVGPPFDKQAYLADTSSRGEITVSGDLFGRSVTLTDLSMTRQKAPIVRGKLALRELDLGAIAKVLVPPTVETEGPAEPELAGRLSGELSIERLALADLSHAKLRFDLAPSVVARGTQRLSIQKPGAPIVVEGDVLTLPPVELRLESGQGFNGAFRVAGTITALMRDPEMNFTATLDPIDLGVLTRLFPRIERAVGRLEGALAITGKLSEPCVSGELHATADEIAARGLPSGFTEVKLDAYANGNELTAAGSARFAGGSVVFNGAAPLRGFSLGAMDALITARGIHVNPAEGSAATFDADLKVEMDAPMKGEGGDVPVTNGVVNRSLPRVSGEVAVTSFEYTRPITLDLSSLGGRARRTVIESYDPALDNIRLDGVRVRTKAPFKIRNNLVEVQLGIDSGELVVTGTDQRVGLRGALKTLPGGRFHFRSNDFEIQQGHIRFEDPTRIDPHIDVLATTEYRRFTDSSAAGRGSSGASLGAGAGAGSHGGALWRISLHAYGDTDNLRLEMTSEPRLSQEDIVLLLTVGMTRAELDQLQTGAVGASIALSALGTASGADRAVKDAIPVIDDFRFGSGTTRTGKTDPQVTVGKRLTDSLRATVTTGLSEDRELRSNIEWRLTQKLSVQGSYDNINDVSSSAVGNVGVDLRWRLEFE